MDFREPEGERDSSVVRSTVPYARERSLRKPIPTFPKIKSREPKRESYGASRVTRVALSEIRRAPAGTVGGHLQGA